jgi:hypothetical protein
MITRREIFKFLGSVPLVGTSITSLFSKQKYKVPSNHLWYENNKGEKWFLKSSEDYTNGPPEGFIYQHSVDANEVRHTIRTSEGLLYSSNNSWNVSIVEQMVKSGDYKLIDAILIVSVFCERCSNAAAYDYKLYGYSRNSEEFKRCNTSCDYCKSKI